MHPPINFAALADALLGYADSLIAELCPGGVMRGINYMAGSVRGGVGNKFGINPKTGKWSDFSDGSAGNDFISLYAEVHGLNMGKAAAELARRFGLEDVAGVKHADDGKAGAVRAVPPPPVTVAVPKRAEPEEWSTILPVPPHALPASFWHFHRNNDQRHDPIDHIAEYALDGQVLGYVVRFLTSDGDKETLPYTWSTSARDGSCKWVWRQWDEPRPLYIPARTLPHGRTVVLVEGEKKAVALHELLEAAVPGVYLVASWPGGCNGWKKALWDWLKGCTVLLWPDCDAKRVKLTKAERESCKVVDDDLATKLAEKVLQQTKPLLPEAKQPGMQAMLGIGGLLRDAHGCMVQLLPIPKPGTVDDGWDCGDAINTDGWDAERVLAFFGAAQPLPDGEAVPVPAKPAGGAGGGKEPPRDGLAGAGGGSSGDDDRSETIGGKLVPGWLACYYVVDKHGNGRWIVSRKMVIAILENEPDLRDVLGLNQLSNNLEALTAWPWPHAKAGPVTGAIDLMLGNYITKKWGVSSIPRAALIEAIETVSHGRPYHPIRQWLEPLKHDGRTRIDSWLIYALGESPDTLAPAVCEYLRLVGRYWLLGMVNRVMEPGCKFDYCPVLEGPGGFGKSTLIEVLAGTPFYSDTHFDVAKGKEGQEQLQGLWMYETAELATFSKAEVGLIKAFITAKVDRYRPSYGRVVESFDRQCLLAGTTNERTYLRDRTGNRRFWPIPVKKRINLAFVIKYREQLFAEAYALYLQGVRFTPSIDEETRLFVPMQEERLVETAVMSEMTNVLTRPGKTEGIASIVNVLTEFVTISQLCLALGVDAAKSSPALESQIRGWLEHEGWERVKKQVNGVRAWGYARPAVWPRPDPETVPEVPPVMGAPGVSIYKEDADDAPF